MKKVLSHFLVSMLIVCTCATGALANEATTDVPIEPADYGQPIAVDVYLDEDGDLITEKIYFVPDTPNQRISGPSGSGWYQKTNQFSPNGRTLTYYAKGYFQWSDLSASVSNASGGVSGYGPGWHDLHEKTTYGTGPGVTQNYAYVNYSFDIRSDPPLSNYWSKSIYLEVTNTGISNGNKV